MSTIPLSSIPLVPDPVPSFASDIEVPSWTIDRTPTNPIIVRDMLLRRSYVRGTSPIIDYSSTNIQNMISRPYESVSITLYRNSTIIPDFEDFIPFNQNPQINLEKNTEPIEEFECTICYENISSNCAKLNCNHIFCNNCIKTQIQKNNICCALCRQKINNITSDNIDQLKKII
jgi:hypothetical protein